MAPSSAAPHQAWRPLGAWLLGAVFVGAAVLKIVDVHAFEGTIDTLVMNALGGTGLPLATIRVAVVLGVIAAEAAVGVWLLAFSRFPRLPALGALVLLGAFSAVLLSMLVMRSPPRCGCLGGWASLAVDARTNAAVGLGRNAALALLALWLVVPPGRTAPRPPPAVRAADGFTLIEMLVVMAVVAVLIAILLPALAGSRLRAREARSLSAIRQCHLGVALYAGAEAGFLPFLGVAGEPQLGTLPDREWKYGPPTFFRGQSVWWPTALAPHGIDLSGLPLNQRHEADDGRVSTYIWLTHTAFARPEYWIGDHPPDSVGLFAGVRLEDAQFPAAKGLFVDIALMEETRDRWNVGMADGSGASRSTLTPALAVDLWRPYGAVEWRVLTTHHGMRGRDY